MMLKKKKKKTSGKLALSAIPNVNTNKVLLHGDETLSFDENIHIYTTVQKYIESIKRFAN